MASLIDPLVRGGLTLGAGFLGSKLVPGRNKTEQDLFNLARGQVTDLSKMGKTVAGQADPFFKLGQQTIGQASPFFDISKGAIQQPTSYWSNILKGGPEALSAMAPDLGNIAQSYEQARKTALATTPRGGGRAGLMANLPFQQAHDVQTLMQQARPAAAQNLLQAGQTAAGVGSNLLSGGASIANVGGGLMGNAADIIRSSTLAGRDLLDYEARQRESERTMGQQVGGSIYDVLFGSKPGQSSLADLASGGIQKLLGIGGATAAGAAATGAGTAGAGAAGAAGAGGAGAGGGLGATVAGLATNPITIAAAAALGGGMLAKKLIGRGRRAADVLTRPGGMQQVFGEVLRDIEAMNLPEPERRRMERQAYDELVQLGLAHAQTGDQQRRVVDQMFNTISPLFGLPNPLRQAAPPTPQPA